MAGQAKGGETGGKSVLATIRKSLRARESTPQAPKKGSAK